MAISTTEGSHPLVRAVGEAARGLAVAAEVPLWSLSAAELRDLVVSLSQLSSALSGVEATVLAQADRSDVAGETASTSTATWLAQATRVTRAAAHGRVRLAKALDEHPVTASALGEGRLVVEQARVILDAVEEVEDIPAELAEKRGLDVAGLAQAAEQRLLGEAAHHDAKALKILARRVLEVIAPEVAEEHERRLLEAEEQRAGERTRLTLSEDGHGLVHGRFTLPAWHAAMLRKALLGLAAPKHQAATGGFVPGRPSPERMGAAFCEYIERYPTDRLPMPVVPRRPWWSPSASTSSRRRSVPASWTTTAASPPPKPGGWRARPPSSRPCSAAPARSSTSDAAVGSTPSRNASPSHCETAAAPQRAVTGHQGCATWACPVFTDTCLIRLHR